MKDINFNARRDDISQLLQYNLQFDQTWQVVDYFERSVASFFGAPYAVATDCCTHALELCLLLTQQSSMVYVPRRTYMSVPMMLDKIKVPYCLTDQAWDQYYFIQGTNIIDAATMWQANSYKAGTLTCISFHFKKHIPIGRGGIVLLDSHDDYLKLQRMVRDGRDRDRVQDEDNVVELGYHYYMTPEDAARGIHLMRRLQDTAPRIWSSSEYRDIAEMDYFKSKTLIANVPVNDPPDIV
jgi:dTDP-4-amino-4,6-dideoxygalactose transaminase